MGIANYRIFGKLFRGKAGNLNGNSPIKHVYKVTGQFTLVIAGNNVESNGNSSLKLDRNGPRYILSPPPLLVFVVAEFALSLKGGSGGLRGESCITNSCFEIQ